MLKPYAEKNPYNFDDDASMYLVSYTFVVTFHPSLNSDRLYVVKSFNHAFEKLNSMNYLSDKMLPYFDPIIIRQLRIVLRQFMKTKNKKNGGIQFPLRKDNKLLRFCGIC